MNESSAASPLSEERLCIGLSVDGREIIVKSAAPLLIPSDTPGGTLMIGGMHGDEVATILLLEDYLVEYGPSLGARVGFLPMANPDGCDRLTRYNARGVDLNRNCETNWHEESVEPPGRGPWSEPESRALRDFIVAWRPRQIVSLHWALAEIDADGPQSTPLAHAMWDALSPEEQAPYRLRVAKKGEGLRRLERTYSFCPGSLGQWCGYGLVYPDGSRPAVITLELPYDPNAKSRPNDLPVSHLEELWALWRKDAPGYMRDVTPAVHKMLTAACLHAVE